MTVLNHAAPGWYPDPADARQLRWWDGTAWSDRTHAAAEADVPQQPAGLVQPQYQRQLPANGCQVCGATPAKPFHLRGHQGMLLLMRFLTYKGQWCRDCGTSRFRQIQSRTLLVGWWGYISVFVNTGTAIWNMAVYRQIRSLGAPQGRIQAPLAQRPSVFATPSFLIACAIPVVLFLVFIH